MATVVSRLEAVLTANTHDFDRGIDKSHTKMQKIGKVAGVAGLAIAGGLAYGLEKSVHAAMEAQVATARLDQAFKTSGISAVKNAKAVDALEKSGRKLGFTDEQTKNALGSLLIATHSMTKASADLNVAQDIARFKHVDLTAATKMLTMAQAGSQRATKQLGLNVTALTDAQDKAKEAYHASLDALDKNSGALKKGTAAQQEQFSALKNNIDTVYAGNLAVAKMTDKQATAVKVIDLVRDKLHGQADAYSKTAAGGMEQFRAQLDHLEVSFGTALLPLIAKVTGALASLLDWFSRHNAVAKITIGVVGALGAAFLLTSAYAKVMASSLVTKLIPALRASTAAMFGLDTAMDANPIGAVIIALAALGIALVIAYKKVAFFRDGVNATFNWIKQNWPLLVGIIGGPIGLALEQIITKRNQIAAAFQALPGMIGNAIGGAMHFLRDKLFEIFNPGKIKAWILEALHFKSPSPFFVDIGRQIISSIAHGVGAYAGILKDAVFGLAKSIPGQALGALGGAVGAIPGARGTIVGESPGGGVHASPDVAKQYAITQLKNYGWGPSQMIGLSQLWNGESGWRWNARNASSGAYGIPQSLPASKMASAGGDWLNNAFTQIRWGLGYIKSRYGSPDAAWSAWQSRSPHWYGKGGVAGLAGPELIGVGEKGPEAIIPLTQTASSFAGPPLAINNTGRPERVGGGGLTVNVHAPGYLGDEGALGAAVMDILQDFQNRNGRPAYGSGF